MLTYEDGYSDGLNGALDRSKGNPYPCGEYLAGYARGKQKFTLEEKIDQVCNTIASLTESKSGIERTGGNQDCIEEAIDELRERLSDLTAIRGSFLEP